MPERLNQELESLGLSADRLPDGVQWRALLERLRLSEERYRVLFEESPLPVLLFGPESLRLLAVNDAAVQLYGYSNEELLTMKLTALKVHEDDPELLRTGAKASAIYEARRTTGRTERAWQGTKKHRKKDGTVFDVDITSHPVSIDGQLATMAICVEVTEKRRLEEQLRQAQKMEAVGQLAGGVAHDFNNMLATVVSFADLAAIALGPDHPVAPDIAQIAAAAQRGGALTRQLLAFSRQTPFQPQVFSLNKAVTSLERMLRRLIGESVSVSTVLGERLGAIRADRGHIDQILLNLAVNARDAMPDGGRLVFETRNTILDEGAARCVGVTPGRYVCLSVSDTGCGMDAETQGRIFEPFFTTKEVGKGTGLGLATVFGLTQQSGGCVTVRSEVGKGATFEVFLPIVERAALSIPVAGPAGARGSARVLLVEDDEQVRNAVRRLLTCLGYSVVAAPHSQAALEIVKSDGNILDVLVTDVVMPDMDGRTLAAQARARHPHLKVLFMSGYAEHIAVKGPAIGLGDQFIQKPFTVQQIGEALQCTLEGGESSTAA